MKGKMHTRYTQTYTYTCKYTNIRLAIKHLHILAGTNTDCL